MNILIKKWMGFNILLIKGGVSLSQLITQHARHLCFQLFYSCL